MKIEINLDNYLDNPNFVGELLRNETFKDECGAYWCFEVEDSFAPILLGVKHFLFLDDTRPEDEQCENSYLDPSLPYTAYSNGDWHVIW